MRVYLDNAATSWPKPEAVYAAVDRWQRQVGAAAGRGGYSEATESGRLVAAARKGVARLIGAADPRRIVFTHNGTDSLNLALHGLLGPGDHVVTTVCEHNSVLRPLAWLAEHRGIAVSYVGCDEEGVVDSSAVRAAIRPETKLFALIHASNVTGAIQPAEAVGRIAAECGAHFLLDAAQTLGQLPIDVGRLGCHLLAAPGHKGLLGPLGTGILYVAPGVEQRLQPLRQGGTGSHSEDERQPLLLPDRYEAGNLNVAGIVGLGAGVNEVLAQGVVKIRAHHEQLLARLLERLQGVAGLRLYGPREASRCVGTLSFNLDGWDPQELAAALDAHHSLQVRAGLHCAPRMHGALGTSPAGCVRASFGLFNTEADIDALAQALAEIAVA